jgi:hypothetical protein
MTKRLASILLAMASAAAAALAVGAAAQEEETCPNPTQNGTAASEIITGTHNADRITAQAGID